MRTHTPTRAPTDAKRCAVYTRKSTAAGLEMEFNSLDAQRESCEAYIQRQPGWTLVAERYDDGGFTGANLERPAFQRLLQDVDERRVDVVLVYKVDRLSRSLLDFARVMERFSVADVSFVSVTQNFSTANAMGRLTLNMLMSFAEFEREMISERVRDKLAAARRKGKWTGGHPPLGYDVVDRRLAVNALEADVVREAFDLFLQCGSTGEVADLLNERGRLTKRSVWNGEIRGARAWTRHTVLRLLRNSLYAGLMTYGKERHQGEHSALVDGSMFRRVQEMLGGVHSGVHSYGRNPDYVLRGLLRCGRCGGVMFPSSSRRRTREYRYYRCSIRGKRGKKVCQAGVMPALGLENFVVAQLRAASVSGPLAKDVHARLTARLEAKHQALRSERVKLPKELVRLEKESTKWLASLSSLEGTERRRVEAKLTIAEEEEAGLKRRLAEVERSLEATEKERVEVEWVAQALADFDAVWDALVPANRGRLLRALIERVVVNDATGCVDVYLAQSDEAAVPMGAGVAA